MRCVKYVFALALLFLLAACSTAPKPAPEPEPEIVLPEGEPEGVIVKRSPGPNPYDATPEPDNAQVRALFDKANAAIVNKQWAKAEALLMDAIALGPNYSGLYFNLGRVYEGLTRLDDAVAQYENAIAMNGNNIYAMNALARIKRTQGKFNEAEALYKQALAVWPDHADSYKNLGILYDLYMGRLQDALEQYRQFQALQAEDDRLMTAWIVDLERRLPAEPAPAAPVESAPDSEENAE
ncbi:tetratricopeptide repeat protein [Simiduia agarivorans]|uniref:TPR domain-containing protein n=1 Tax=Simiduia agarivorans (strain DSM 21679 / JCM 13881 / BCRC 17597 / SA1) TaxID=1117647 RepID=K4L086_SIMAS|nr:tetratricopeptide repeat protein [Simiduia agarivorans]AFU99582.1 putative TPR domain-containing protein [Simiduia agarivorans SA1 = DSM 21679]